ncbi:MAG: hypothetical protein ACRENF_02285 [Thermodesulfobacteriota bacterium]
MSSLSEKEIKTNVNETRRKLLKLGVYSVPAVLFLGKVSGAKASGQPVGPRNDHSGEGGCGFFEKIATLGFCK